MDPSIRLEMILGNHKVEAEELKPEERLAIVEKLLEMSRPQLKYMPGFKEIRDMMNVEYGYCGSIIRRETNLNVVKWAECMSRSGIERVTGLAQVSHSVWCGHGTGPCQNEPHFFEEVELLLTKSGGGIYKWEQKYRREGRITEVAIISAISSVRGDELQVLLTPSVFLNIVASIRMLIVGCVEERKNRLASMQGLLQHVTTVTDHLIGSFGPP